MEALNSYVLAERENGQVFATLVSIKSSRIFLYHICEVKMKSLSRVLLFATTWTVADQASPSVGFSRQDTGLGCHFLLQGIFPTQGLNPGLPHCRQTLYPLSHQGSPAVYVPLPNKNPIASQISRIRPKELLESSHPFFASALQYISRAMVTKICDQT